MPPTCPPFTGPYSHQLSWSEAERLLQQLAAEAPTAADWAARAGTHIVGLPHLMLNGPRREWPAWLLVRLSAAVARGLTPTVLGMSGPKPTAAILLDKSSPKDSPQVGTILHTLSCVGELMKLLTQVLGTLTPEEDEPRHSRPSEPELLKIFTSETSLLPNVGAAAGNMATFLTKYNALKHQDTSDSHTAAVTYCLVGLPSGLLDLWTSIAHLLPNTGLLSKAPAAVQQTVQPIVNVAVTLLQAFPGPLAAQGPTADQIELAAALEIADVSQETLTAAWVYKSVSLERVLLVAATISSAVVHEVWSRASGSPAAAVKSDTPQPVLQLLQQQQTKYLMAFEILMVTASSHSSRSGQATLDTSAFPISSRSRTFRRHVRAPACQQPAQQGSRQQEQQPEVEPYHDQLEAVMGLSGCTKEMLSRGPYADLDSQNCLVALQCCCGATLSSRGLGALGPHINRAYSTMTQAEVLPPGFCQPLMLVLSELVQMQDDIQLVVFALNMLQGLFSAYADTQALVRPLVGGLLPFVVQAVRTGDASKTWSTEIGLPGDFARGSMLEVASNMMAVLLEPNVTGVEGTAIFHKLVKKQPAVMLSTLDALMRARAECEAMASDTVFSRRIMLYPAPPGVKLPEAMRVLQQILTGCLADLHGCDPKPSRATAMAVLDSPSTAGAALLGLLISAQKYALRALGMAPAVSAWDAAVVATCIMLNLHLVAAAAVDMELITKSAAQLLYVWPVVWSEATDAAVAAAKADAEDDELEFGTGFKLVPDADEDDAAAKGAALAQKLGPQLLPAVVQLYARSLLLLTTALLLPPQALSLGMAASIPQVQQWMQNKRTQYQAHALVTTCFVTTQFLELLLPHMQRAAPAAAGSISQVLPPAVMKQLVQQAAACSKALGAIKSALDKKTKPPEATEAISGDVLLQSAKKAFAMKDGSSSSTSAGGSTSLLLQLQQFASDLLGQLPSKMCTNHNCVQLGDLSEKELCEKRCSACKSSYCSKECSRQHWKQHKPLCQRLTAAAASAALPAAAAAGLK